MVGVTAAPHLILVTPRDSYRAGDFLQAAEELGCRVTVVTDAEIALPGSAILMDLADPEAAAAGPRLDAPPDAVVGTDGMALVVAATVAERFGLVTSPAAAVRRATDKLAQRRALHAERLRQPRWGVVGTDGAWPDLGAGPLVIKPTDRGGGQGVIRVNTREEGRLAVGRVRSLIGSDGPILVERYVSGREVAVDALVVDGEVRPIAVFDKPDPGDGPFFAETLLVRPGRMSAGERDGLFELVAGAVEAIGLTDGPVHVEARVDGDGLPWFLELAPRSIGGLCSRMVHPGGMPLEELILGAALGRPLPTNLECDGPATGVYMIPVPRAGRLESVAGVEQASAVPGITGVDITAGPGSELVPLPEGDRYLGFVFAEGDGPDRVEASLRGAADALVISVSPSGSRDRTRPRDR